MLLAGRNTVVCPPPPWSLEQKLYFIRLQPLLPIAKRRGKWFW